MGFFIMSLRVRSLANSMTVAVNGNVNAVLKVSEGYTVTPDGTQVPKYIEQAKILQRQSMDVEDLKHMGFANQQGQFMSIYADGMIPAIRRGMQLGTTLIYIVPYGETVATIWQVKYVIESYDDWVKVLIQNTGKSSL